MRNVGVMNTWMSGWFEDREFEGIELNMDMNNFRQAASLGKDNEMIWRREESLKVEIRI